nr:MAG TPA: hypothetical protein [Caudoviricetes sp.]
MAKIIECGKKTTQNHHLIIECGILLPFCYQNYNPIIL